MGKIKDRFEGMTTKDKALVIAGGGVVLAGTVLGFIAGSKYSDYRTVSVLNYMAKVDPTFETHIREVHKQIMAQ